jgi:flagellar protein FliS
MNPMMSSANVASRYRGVQLNTASPAQLVVMLYDGLLRFVGEADEALGRDDRARAGERIGKAIAIVDELAATLDPTHAPELVENLLGLYGFCKRRLFEANLGRDRKALADVVASLTPLREAWAAVVGKK